MTEKTREQKLSEIKKVSAVVSREFKVIDGRNTEVVTYANGTVKYHYHHKDSPDFKTADQIEREANSEEQNAIADLQKQVAELTKLLAAQSAPAEEGTGEPKETKKDPKKDKGGK